MLMIMYGITSLILGIVLYFPIKKFIAAMMINRLQRKQNRAATREETDRITRRAIYMAAVLSVTFAFIFNKYLMLQLYGGLR